MNTSLPRAAPWQIVARILTPGQISILVVEAARIEEAVAELVAEAEALGELVRVVRGSASVEQTLNEVREGDAALTIVACDAFPERAGEDLDLWRARLPDDRPLVFLMTPGGAKRLLAESHHFESFVQQVEHLDLDPPSMSAGEVEDRIRSLELWSGMTSERMLDRAAAGEIPADPDYAEWLILLNRGDLLGPR